MKLGKRIFIAATIIIVALITIKTFSNTSSKFLSKDDSQVNKVAKLISSGMEEATKLAMNISTGKEMESELNNISEETALYLQEILPKRLAKEFSSEELVKIEKHIAIDRKINMANLSAIEKIKKEAEETIMKSDAAEEKPASNIFDKFESHDLDRSNIENTVCKKTYIVDPPKIQSSYHDSINQKFTTKLHSLKIKNVYKGLCRGVSENLDEKAESYANYIQNLIKQEIASVANEKEFLGWMNFNESPLGSKYAKLMEEIGEGLNNNVFRASRYK